MRSIVQLFFFLSIVFTVNAQELNCLVSVNSDKIAGSNKQVYTTLQTALNEFVNQTKWTSNNYKPQEKITCAFNIIINSQTGNRFNASIQVQAARPIYGTSYASPILNIKDTDFDFTYNEFEPLNYNAISFDSNLVSTLVYYVYVILGVDADTFALNGGASFLKEAENVLLLAQQGGGSGWTDQVGKNNRYSLLDNLTSPKFRKFKNVLYNYHRKGMDNLASDTDNAKKEIRKAVLTMQELFNKSIGNHIIRIFFDAKSDEIVSVFSEGKRTANFQLKQVLERISPNNNSKWKKIK